MGIKAKATAWVATVLPAFESLAQAVRAAASSASGGAGDCATLPPGGENYLVAVVSGAAGGLVAGALVAYFAVRAIDARLNKSNK